MFLLSLLGQTRQIKTCFTSATGRLPLALLVSVILERVLNSSIAAAPGVYSKRAVRESRPLESSLVSTSKEARCSHLYRRARLRVVAPATNVPIKATALIRPGAPSGALSTVVLMIDWPVNAATSRGDKLKPKLTLRKLNVPEGPGIGPAEYGPYVDVAGPPVKAGPTLSPRAVLRFPKLFWSSVPVKGATLTLPSPPSVKDPPRDAETVVFGPVVTIGVKKLNAKDCGVESKLPTAML